MKLMNYLYSSAPFENHYPVAQELFNQPKSGRSIIEDFYKENPAKVHNLIHYIHDINYFCGLICGNAGSGKSSLMHFIGKLYKDFYPNDKIYYYEEVRTPSWSDGPIWGVNQVDNCLIFFNEMAKAFPSRESAGGSNQQISSNLLDNRHYGVKYLGCNIRLSMVDINLVRSCNCFLYKYMTPEVLMLDRKELINPLLLRMLPSKECDKGEVLSVIEGQYSKFRYELSKDFTEELSKSRKLSESEKLNVAVQKFNEGMEIKDLKKYMLIRFRFNKSLDFWDEYFEDI